MILARKSEHVSDYRQKSRNRTLTPCGRHKMRMLLKARCVSLTQVIQQQICSTLPFYACC